MLRLLLLLAALLPGCVAVVPKRAVTGAYAYIYCSASAVVRPSSTAQLAQVVRGYAAQAAGGRGVSLRSTRNLFHSSAHFVCPDASRSAAPAAAFPRARVPSAGGATTTVLVLHERLNKVLAVDRAKNQMRVGAGMDVKELTTAATKAGMSVPVGSMPAYAGLTLGGVLLTSAHGSGFGTVHNLEDILVSVTFVDGRGRVVTLPRSHPDFKAVPGSMGLMGVVTEMTLQLTPPTNTQLITWRQRSDKQLMKDIEKMLKVSPHVLVKWRPDIGQYNTYMIRQAPKGAKADPTARMLLLPDMRMYEDVDQREFIATAQHRLVEDPTEIAIACPLAADTVLERSAWAITSKGPAWNVTGPTNTMQAADCGAGCGWTGEKTMNITTQDVELTVEYDRLAEWIADVKKIIDIEVHDRGRYKVRCLGLGYYWIRFGRGTPSYLSTAHGMKRPVYLQATWMRSRRGALETGAPLWYQFVADLIEEHTLCKYGGRPHWGKNFDRTFTHPRCGLRKVYPQLDTAVRTAARYDPQGMFRPALFDKVVRGESYRLFPRCAVDQSCYCQRDEHCWRGLSCVPAASFPQYRICKYVQPKPKPAAPRRVQPKPAGRPAAKATAAPLVLPGVRRAGARP